MAFSATVVCGVFGAYTALRAAKMVHSLRGYESFDYERNDGNAQYQSKTIGAATLRWVAALQGVVLAICLLMGLGVLPECKLAIAGTVVASVVAEYLLTRTVRENHEPR